MDFSIVKRHPYAFGGGLVGLIILWLLFRNSNSGSNVSAGGNAVNPQLAAIDTAAQVQTQQINAAQNVAQIQADTSRAQIDAQLKLGLATVNAGTSRMEIEGSTISDIVKSQSQVKLSQIALQKSVYDTLAKNKKLGGSSTGVSQILSALFYGRGPEAIAANQPSSVGSSPSAILGGVSSVVSSLFG